MLVKALRHRQAMSSDEIAEQANLSRGTTVHHLNKLMESGIVSTDRKKYTLRVDNLSSLISEIEKDIKRAT